MEYKRDKKALQQEETWEGLRVISGKSSEDNSGELKESTFTKKVNPQNNGQQSYSFNMVKKKKNTQKQLLNGPLGAMVLNVEVIKDTIFMKSNPVQRIYSLWLVNSLDR